MFKNYKTVALIPLRGGSKSIPYKNIKKIAGKPLAYWICDAAKKAKYIDGVYVSTEDKKIKEVINSFGLGINIIDRPPELAINKASTDSVMLHFAKKVNFDILVTLQATTPLTTDNDINKAIKQFVEDESDSLLTGVLLKRFFWSENNKSLNYNYLNRPMRQDFKGTIMENGAFYITKREILKKYKNRLGGKISIFKMPEETAIELDGPKDWEVVEKLLLEKKPNKIR